MVEWMTERNEKVGGKLTYQRRKQLAALELTDRRGCMVDVGAHCGLWAMHLAREFRAYLAFEPVTEHVRCLEKNCKGIPGLYVYEMALGAENGRTEMYTNPESSGDSYPRPGVRDGNTIVRRYDDLTIDTKVDLVKLDCEGYELFVLQGMREMLERDKPAVVVEQKTRMAAKFHLQPQDAVRYLEGLGATCVREMAGDFFLTW